MEQIKKNLHAQQPFSYKVDIVDFRLLAMQKPNKSFECSKPHRLLESTSTSCSTCGYSPSLLAIQTLAEKLKFGYEWLWKASDWSPENISSR